MRKGMINLCENILFLIIHMCIKLKRLLTCDDMVPKLHCLESALTNHLVRRRGLLQRPFKPPWIIQHPYIQTLLGYMTKPLDVLEFEREYVQMGNKSVIALDWYTALNSKLRNTSPVVIIFPRLTGDAESVGHICKVAATRGLRSVVLNRRGHGSSVLTAIKLTSTGDPSDTKHAIEYIVYKYPCASLVGIGEGAGCATLFSYLGEFGSSSVFKAAVCISPSYDNTEKLCEQIPKFYELLLLLHLKIMLMRYTKALHKIIDINAAIFRAWTLKEFDYHVYCKMYGIETFEAFWNRNDPMRDVDDIAVPVLCINSRDDPVSTLDMIPFELFGFYPNMLLVTVEKGGHCAFLEDIWSHSWADTLAMNYIEGVLEFVSTSKFWFK